MLQIITGKFFTTDDLYVTPHRAVLYSNYAPLQRMLKTPAGQSLTPVTLETPAGSLRSTTVSHPPGEVYPWIYEVEEKLEAVRPDGTRDFLIAVGADFFVHDFAAVAAFALNITCTPDLDLARRLIHSQHSALGVPHPPKAYMGRVFDQRIEPQDDDGARLQGFVRDLVGLERQTYKAAMRAIRRYVSGLHHIADDLDLAYVLLVTSIESLAQGFDAFTPQWEDFPHDKRATIDEVLSRGPEDVASGVREVLLAHEHLALGRRFREFALKHLSPSFFREEVVGESSPVRRSDLPAALERAYVFRSKYVHTLLELPRNLTASPSTADTSLVEGGPALTIYGLARIARHVIGEFIARAPKCEREKLDYRKELPNIVHIQLAFSMWGGFSSGYSHKSARRYLSGFLDDYTAYLTREPQATVTLTDIRPLVEKVETLMPGLTKAEQRLPLLTLYVLYHHCFPPEYHRPDREQLFNRYAGDFDAPSIESMLLHVLLDWTPSWTLEQFEAVRRAYFKQRRTKNRLEFGAILEAAVTLFSAELHRREGHIDRARELVSEAVENLPGRTSLLEFERRMAEEPPPVINWWELLLPARAKVSSDEAQGGGPGDSQDPKK